MLHENLNEWLESMVNVLVNMPYMEHMGKAIMI